MSTRFVKSSILSLIVAFLAVTASALGDQKFQIGIILPLSGSSSPWGAGILAAGQMAFESLPADVKNNIELKYEDDHFDPKSAITAFHHLVDEKKVDSIIVFGSGSALAIAPLAEAAGIPTISLGLTPKAHQGRKWVMQHWVQVESLVAAIFNLIQESKTERLAILSSEHEAYVAIHEMLLRKSLQAGIRIIDAEYLPLDAADLHFLIPKLKNLNVDTLALCLLPHQNKAFASIALQAHFNFKIIGCNGLDTPSLSIDEKRLLKGVPYPVIGMTDEFLSRYRLAYPGKEWLGVGNMYDAVQLIAKALVSEHGEREKVLRALHNSPIKSDVFGEYTFNKDGYFQVPIRLKNIQ